MAHTESDPEFEVDELVMGQAVRPDEKRLLETHSEEEYANRVRDIQTQKRLHYNTDDLAGDFDKHGRAEFGFSDVEAFKRKARSIVQHAREVCVHVWNGELQFVFYGKEGYTVVDEALSIRNCSGHPKPGAARKAFTIQRRRKLWLRQTERGFGTTSS